MYWLGRPLMNDIIIGCQVYPASQNFSVQIFILTGFVDSAPTIRKCTSIYGANISNHAVNYPIKC